MRLWHGLSKRFLVAMILAAASSLFAAQAVARYSTREQLLRSSAPILVALYAKYLRAACEASPATFEIVADGMSLHAYDDATLVSSNGNAPDYPSRPLPPPGFVDVEPFGDDGAGLSFRLEERGVCSVARLRWSPRPARAIVATALLTGSLFALLAAGGLAVLVVIRPFLQRIEEVRRAAEGVGDEDVYAPARNLGGDPDDELGVVATSLDRAHGRILRDASILAERQKQLQRSLADVAHDLRTPLASLQLTLEELDREAGQGALSSAITRAMRDTVYLTGLTNNLHLASQLRDGWSPTTAGASLDLAETVRRVVDRARTIARREGIAVEGATPDGEVRALGDPTATEQALANVVENAVFHGVAGGHVAVVLDEQPRGRFLLTVSDDGPGVDELTLPRLGERTFRSDEARQRDQRGRGLGLAIAHEVCARSGWELRFEHATPHGLRVVLRGPLASKV